MLGLHLSLKVSSLCGVLEERQPIENNMDLNIRSFLFDLVEFRGHPAWLDITVQKPDGFQRETFPRSPVRQQFRQGWFNDFAARKSDQSRENVF